MTEAKILVSIVVITYGHEKYIQQALDSILQQETNFDYEIVVGEDCSPDGTRKILKEYERKFPKKFKMLYREKNLGATLNFYDTIQHCNGKYIIMLEGDDYWNAAYKLQKQTEFLEKNNDFIGVVHSCRVISDDNVASRQKEESYRRKESLVFTFEDYKTNRIPGHTCTLMYRNIFKNPQHNYDIVYTADKNTADRTINMLLLAQGDIYCMDEAMSTYRMIKKKGATNINSLYLGRNMLYHNWIYESILDEYCHKTFGKGFLTNENVAKYWGDALHFRITGNNAEDKEIFRKFNLIVLERPQLIFWIIKKALRKAVRKQKKRRDSK